MGFALQRYFEYFFGDDVREYIEEEYGTPVNPQPNNPTTRPTNGPTTRPADQESSQPGDISGAPEGQAALPNALEPSSTSASGHDEITLEGYLGLGTAVSFSDETVEPQIELDELALIPTVDFI